MSSYLALPLYFDETHQLCEDKVIAFYARLMCIWERVRTEWSWWLSMQGWRCRVRAV